MDHRAPPTPPPRELQLPPSPVVPVRRRRSQRSPRQAAAAIPVVVPPPAALPVDPSAPRRQIPAPPAAAGAPDADADADYYYLMLLAHTVVSQADAEEAEALSRPAPAPAPAPAGEKRLRRSSPPLAPAAATDEEKEKPYDAPPLPPLAVDESQSSFLSMGGGVAASPAAGAGGSPMQLGDDHVEELEPGEIPPEKLLAAARCNAGPAAHESLLGKQEVEMAAGDEEANKTIAGREPATAGSSAHRAAAPTVEEKRKREVFVGGLSRDATEDDVRAALSAAGVITQVRMFPDRLPGKNKGYCFVAYRDAAMASKAVAEFGTVKICGKQCRVAVPEGDEKAKTIAQRDPNIEDYIYEQRQPSPTLAAQSSYITSWNHHASYVAPPVVAGYYYHPMYHHSGNIVYLPPPPPPDFNHHGLLGAGPWGRNQMGQSGSNRPAGQPRRSRN